MHIIGTAGHVDHGKSSLVAALTGTNPDRWLEEQLRGMTLDLGFAHLRYDDGIEAGIVDVPGHERFLHNMLAGAAGMDLLLLVIAANEGIREQTVEHLQILRFLNVQRVVVALTKMDLIEPERGGEVCRDVHEALHDTIAADAPIFAISTLTGANIDALRLGLHQELSALAPRDAQAPVYLPIDRVFALSGRGTIVTGTLMQGRIAAGDTLMLQPQGRSVRARTLHVFGAQRSEATGGTRVALNLPGVEKSDLARGDVLASPRFEPRSSFTVRFQPLAQALALMRRRIPVRVHIGSAELIGTIVFGEVPQTTDVHQAELHLRAPVLAFPGAHFVVRRMSPKTLLGGGTIDALSATALADDGRSANEQAVAQVLHERGLEPSDTAAVAFRANLRDDAAHEVLEALCARGEALRLSRPEAYLDIAAARELLARVVTTLEEAQTREPWIMGVTSIALSRLLDLPESLVVRILAAFLDDGRIASRAGYYATPDHQPQLTADQRRFFDTVVPHDPEHPFIPAALDAATQAMRTSAIAGIAKAFETLCVRGALVKVGDQLYRGNQVREIHERVERFVSEHGRMTMAEFRDLIGTSRKYAVPLLEWFDGRGITVRSGDFRMLRSKSKTTI